MPTASKTWAFASNTEGLNDLGVSGVVFEFLGTDGNPSGCVRFTQATKAVTQTEEASGGATTFASHFGIPTDATVSQARLLGMYDKVANNVKLTSHSLVAVQLRDPDGNVIAQLIQNHDPGTATTGWVAIGTQSPASFTKLGSDNCQLWLVYTVVTSGGGGGAAVDYRLDQIEVEITYTEAPTGEEDTLTQTQTATITESGADADAVGVSAASSQSSSHADSEALITSAVSRQRIDAYRVYPTGVSTQTILEDIVLEATEETVTSVGSSTQVISEAEQQSLNNSSASTQTLLEAIEIVEAPLQSIGTASPAIDESIVFAETITNSQTASLTVGEATAEGANTSASGSQTQTEAEAQSLSNSASSTQTILEAIEVVEQPLQNVGTASLTIDEQIAFVESLTNSQTGSQTIASSEVEAISNVSSSTQSIVEAIQVVEAPLQNISTASISTQESVSEAANSSAESTQTMEEETSLLSMETITSSATSTQTTVESISESEDQSGSGSHLVSEATAETKDTSQTGVQNISEAIEQIEPPLVNVAQSTQTIGEFVPGEVVQDTLDNVATSSQFMSFEGTAEYIDQRTQCPEFIQVIGLRTQSMMEVIAAEGEEEPPTPAPPGDIAVYQGGQLFPLQKLEESKELLQAISSSDQSILEEVIREVTIYVERPEDDAPAAQIVEPSTPLAEPPAQQIIPSEKERVIPFEVERGETQEIEEINEEDKWKRIRAAEDAAFFNGLL